VFYYIQGLQKLQNVTNSDKLMRLSDMDFQIVRAVYAAKEVRILDGAEQNTVTKSIIRYLFTDNYDLR
jgi:hypothetical protein